MGEMAQGGLDDAVERAAGGAGAVEAKPPGYGLVRSSVGEAIERRRDGRDGRAGADVAKRRVENIDEIGEGGPRDAEVVDPERGRGAANAGEEALEPAGRWWGEGNGGERGGGEDGVEAGEGESDGLDGGLEGEGLGRA